MQERWVTLIHRTAEVTFPYTGRRSSYNEVTAVSNLLVYTVYVLVVLLQQLMLTISLSSMAVSVLKEPKKGLSWWNNSIKHFELVNFN